MVSREQNSFRRQLGTAFEKSTGRDSWIKIHSMEVRITNVNNVLHSDDRTFIFHQSYSKVMFPLLANETAFEEALIMILKYFC